jgi:arylsulfatase A-like enzyme
MSSKKPNIIVMFSDQQRWDTLGCYGQKLPVSPNLDKMAEEGVKFDTAFTCQPVCGPVRACLQTGKYATEVGCETNGRHLPLDSDTIARRMKGAGYKTGYIGKWHLASGKNRFDGDFNPQYQIFPIPEELRGGYEYWLAADCLESTSHGYDGHMYDNDNQTRNFPLYRYRADAHTDWVLEYLDEQSKDDPFFLFVSYIEPHHQNDYECYQGPRGSKEYWANYDIPGDLAGLPGDWVENYPDYLGCCNALDNAVGRVNEKLEELGMDDNTLIIYISDHGTHFRTRNKEYKRSCHDGCLRIPMILNGPGFKGGEVNESLASLIDIPKTILTAAQVEIPEDWQGIALQNAIGKDDIRDAVFAQISEDHVGRAVRTKKWKYEVWLPLDMMPKIWNTAKSEDDVYYERFLYDLESDPHERNNLISDPNYTEIRSELAEILKAKMAEAKEPIPEIKAARK